MQKPTVGRIVHCYDFGGWDKESDAPKLGRLRPGIICAVPETGDCEVAVIGLGLGYATPMPFSETPKPGCWTWPPRT